jgi:hypothetical protein
MLLNELHKQAREKAGRANSNAAKGITSRSTSATLTKKKLFPYEPPNINRAPGGSIITMIAVVALTVVAAFLLGLLRRRSTGRSVWVPILDTPRRRVLRVRAGGTDIDVAGGGQLSSRLPCSKRASPLSYRPVYGETGLPQVTLDRLPLEACPGRIEGDRVLTRIKAGYPVLTVSVARG